VTRATILGLLLVLVATARADRESAGYFTSRGEKALAEEKNEEAVKHFEKALSEQPKYLPAMLGLARAANARGEKEEAIRHLLECLDVARNGGLPAEEQEAAWQAEALLKELEPERLEFRKIVDDYVKKLLELAKRYEKTDPELARRCAQRILALLPGHEKALAMAGDSAPAAAAAPAAAVADESALFNGKDLEGWDGVCARFKVKDGVLEGSVEDAAYYLRGPKSLEGDYTLVFEMRITKAGADAPKVGLVFGFKGGYERFDVSIFTASFSLGRYNQSTDLVQIDRKTSAEVRPVVILSKWNRYTIQVRGKTATVRVNGQPILTGSAEAKAFDGFPAIVVQNCTAEFRKVAAGK
jgi:hypothetical protein